MRNSTTRRLFSLAVWLAVGLVLTVGLAWAFAIGYTDAKSMYAAMPQPTEWPDVAPSGWGNPIYREDYGRSGISVQYAWTDDVQLPFRKMLVMRTGLPLPALRRTILEEVLTSSLVRPPLSHRDGLKLPYSVGRTLLGNPVSLPLRPCWTGLVLDTLFYAALARGVWQIPILLRRRSRVRAGKCIGCGYDRRGIAAGVVCPECGGSA